MKDFAKLINNLDKTNKTNDKVAILVEYFKSASKDDLIWALYFLLGNKIQSGVNSTQLKRWAYEYSKIPDWLFEESYHSVGDLSETISLILPKNISSNSESLKYWTNYLKNLKALKEEERKSKILEAWSILDQSEVFAFNKLITSGFRLGISQNLTIRALAKALDIDKNILIHKLTGTFDPSKISLDEILNSNIENTRPYPFFLSTAITDFSDLGPESNWIIEWKWDGIRAQVIVRNNEIFIWSRGEELITDRFPEFQSLKNILSNGTTIDGEILVFKDHPEPFGILQTRIGRKNISSKILSDSPVILYAYDLLELNGEDIRTKPLKERKQLLKNLVENIEFGAPVKFSPIVELKSWSELANLRGQARENFAEGLMIKKADSVYGIGRKKDWWKWKIDPLSIDAVLIYAQKGHGRRANLYTDYTFGVWSDGKLLPIAKAYSGLTDKEILEVDKFIRFNTLEKFGPVRTVKPKLVFEIGFEGINLSPRHKSGIAVRFPRILRQRFDKKIEEADSLDSVKELLKM